VAVDVDFSTHEANYKKLYSNLKNDTNGLVAELKAMQKSHPELKDRLKTL